MQSIKYKHPSVNLLRNFTILKLNMGKQNYAFDFSFKNKKYDHVNICFKDFFLADCFLEGFLISS